MFYEGEVIKHQLLLYLFVCFLGLARVTDLQLLLFILVIIKAEVSINVYIAFCIFGARVTYIIHISIFCPSYLLHKKSIDALIKHCS